MQLEDKTFEVFLTAKVIQDRIKTLAQELKLQYNDQEVLALVVLNGALFFATDLLKQCELNIQISCIRLSSYNGTHRAASVQQTLELDVALEGKNVLIIEDIVDSGQSLDTLYEVLDETQFKSLKTVALLYKPSAHKGKIKPDFVGFHIPNAFVVGYGLDYKGWGRTKTHIYQLKD